MTSSSLPWFGTGLTDTGRVRASNQDAFAIDNELGLWVIADGMGGHTGGNVASELAIASILHSVRSDKTPWPHERDQLDHANRLLTEAIAAGNAAIRQRIATAPELLGMGTTVVIALLCRFPPLSVAIAHMGDSRAYVIRDGRLTALTTDHSLVQQLVTAGRITHEESLNHPKKNVLVKALGVEHHATPDIWIHELKADDVLILCTDGLTKMLSEEEILSVILETSHSPEETCQRLITRANAAGGKDNTTVLLISSCTHS